MNNEDAPSPRPPSEQPRRERAWQQRLVRLFGGYTKNDLKEACRVAVSRYKASENGCDSIDVPSWHREKFGKPI